MNRFAPSPAKPSSRGCEMGIGMGIMGLVLGGCVAVLGLLMGFDPEGRDNMLSGIFGLVGAGTFVVSVGYLARRLWHAFTGG